MSATTVHHGALLLLLIVLGVGAPSDLGPPLQPGITTRIPPAAAGRPLAGSSPPVSLTPVVSLRGGSARQRERVSHALQRFRDAGMALPDLDIHLAYGDPDRCRGHHGLFQRRARPSPWRITICKDVEYVYLHELAHAWEAATLTDVQREGFMRLRGYDVWSDPAVPRDQRGMEGAAFIIQQGLHDGPLPRDISDEHVERLEAFELLTGSPAPRGRRGASSERSGR